MINDTTMTEWFTYFQGWREKAYELLWNMKKEKNLSLAPIFFALTCESVL